MRPNTLPSISHRNPQNLQVSSCFVTPQRFQTLESVPSTCRLFPLNCSSSLGKPRTSRLKPFLLKRSGMMPSSARVVRHSMRESLFVHQTNYLSYIRVESSARTHHYPSKLVLKPVPIPSTSLSFEVCGLKWKWLPRRSSASLNRPRTTRSTAHMSVIAVRAFLKP